MSLLTEYGARVDAKFNELSSAIDGVSGDVSFLKSEIEKLQNTPGELTPEDQAILDGIEARLGNITTSLVALDEATAAPIVPPTE